MLSLPCRTRTEMGLVPLWLMLRSDRVSALNHHPEPPPPNACTSILLRQHNRDCVPDDLWLKMMEKIGGVEEMVVRSRLPLSLQCRVFTERAMHEIPFLNHLTHPPN